MATVLLTGASGGIGTTVAKRLSDRGDQLVLAARDVDRLEALRVALPVPPSLPHVSLKLDMASEASVVDFGNSLAASGIDLDGAVLMPPQPHSSSDPMPVGEVWRTLFQTSFIGPLMTFKATIERMRPNPSNGHRCKIVIISGISSAQVLSRTSRRR